MKVLIVGGGGREHAIAEKLLENPRIDTLYAAPGNGGMAAMATCLPIKATDIQAITDFCVKETLVVRFRFQKRRYRFFCRR